jgi:hypothetical protein
MYKGPPRPTNSFNVIQTALMKSRTPLDWFGTSSGHFTNSQLTTLSDETTSQPPLKNPTNRCPNRQLCASTLTYINERSSRVTPQCYRFCFVFIKMAADLTARSFFKRLGDNNLPANTLSVSNSSRSHLGGGDIEGHSSPDGYFHPGPEVHLIKVISREFGRGE